MSAIDQIRQSVKAHAETGDSSPMYIAAILELDERLRQVEAGAAEQFAPCPECESTNLVMHQNGADFQVRCLHCDAAGPKRESWAAATAGWRRAGEMLKR